MPKSGWKFKCMDCFGPGEIFRKSGPSLGVVLFKSTVYSNRNLLFGFQFSCPVTLSHEVMKILVNT